MRTTDAQRESLAIVHETRETIDMLRALTAKLELYNTLLETEISKQQDQSPKEAGGGDEQ